MPSKTTRLVVVLGNCAEDATHVDGIDAGLAHFWLSLQPPGEERFEVVVEHNHFREGLVAAGREDWVHEALARPCMQPHRTPEGQRLHPASCDVGTGTRP